jgi:uncharacterized OsmC-like protein
MKSGVELITDAPTDNQGKGESFSPTDMLATSLASCIITIMGIKARDANLEIKGTKARVEKLMAANPRRIGQVNIVPEMPKKTFSQSEKKILEDAATGCPVCRSISPSIKVSLNIEWPKS